jgi:hypothetical protein
MNTSQSGTKEWVMTHHNLRNLPVIDRETIDMEALEADLAMANKRCTQAARRRNEILEAMREPLRKKAINDLHRRGITLNETHVVVSYRDWPSDEWRYKTVLVKDVTIRERRTGGLDPDDWFSVIELEVEYEYALVRKDGKPSRAPSGLSHRTTQIERIA